VTIYPACTILKGTNGRYKNYPGGYKLVNGLT